MNTKPPINDDKVRSIWTAKDEAALQELQQRRERIMSAHRQRLEDVLLPVFETLSPAEVDSLLACAEQLRDALAPFDSRVQS